MTDPTSGATGNAGGQNQPTFKFDPSLPHQARPRLRAIRGFGAQREGQQLLGLADARQISDKVVFTAPAAQFILPHLDGSNDLDAVVKKVNEQVASMAAQQGAKVQGKLERSFLETFVATRRRGPLEAHLRRHAEEGARAVRIVEHAAPSVTANFADILAMQELGQDASESAKAEIGATKMREQFDAWIAEAFKSVDNPSFDHLPAAVIAPHLDYGRGWMNYAHVYGRMRVVDKPDRVIILGTNHFGLGTGVVGCAWAWNPLASAPRRRRAASLRRRFEDGERRLLKDKARRHGSSLSIELGRLVQHVRLAGRRRRHGTS